MSASPTILLLDRIQEGGGERMEQKLSDRLPEAPITRATTSEESKIEIEDAEVVLAQSLSIDLLKRAPELRWVQALSSGVDAYEPRRLQEEGIILTNVAGVHAEPIGEQTLGYMLMFERRLHIGIHQQFERTWHRYYGGELKNKTLGVVGLGAIGTRTAELAKAFGMEVLGTKRTPDDGPECVDIILGSSGLDVVLDRADYLVLSCPLTEETQGLIGAAELERMSKSSVLINVARGEVVEESALVSALDTESIRGAALDVFDEEPLPKSSPLWDHSNVVLTPHMAGSTPEYWRRCADIFVRNYKRFREGNIKPMENRVNNTVY